MKAPGSDNLLSFALLVLSCVSASLVISLAFIAQPETAKQWLSSLTVASNTLCLLLTISGLVLSKDSFAKYLRQISRQGWLELGFVFLVAASIITFVVPRTNRIYFDEHIYQGIAQSISHTGKALMCNHGDAENGSYFAQATEYNKEPNGYPFYLALFFKIFGISETSAHLANAAAYLLGVLAIYLLVWFLTRSELAAIYSAFCYTFTPMVANWAGTAAAEPSAAGFAILAFLAAAFYVNCRDWASLLLFVGALGWAMQFRPESILLAIPVLLYVSSKIPGWYRDRQIVILTSLLATILAPALLHLFVVKDESWGSPADKFALEYFYNNISVNGLFYLTNERYPLLFTVAAVLGLIFYQGLRVEKLALLCWFLYSWGIFLFFYAGSYNFGVDVRFSLISAGPLAVFAGMGLAAITTELGWPVLFQRFSKVIVAVSTIILSLSFLPQMRTIGNEAFQARWDLHSAREFAKVLPPDSIVLAHNPSIWLMLGKNAAQASFATYNPATVDNDFFRRYSGGVYFHYNIWCDYQDQVQNSFCSNIEKAYELKPIQEIFVVGEKFGLYRLVKKDP